MTDTINVRSIHGRVDFAIITIREDEFEATLKRFEPNISVIGGRQFYQYCRFKRPDGLNLILAIGRTTGQGHSAAQLFASQAIEDLKPRWLVLTGIAGGFPDSDFSLGDVLLASSLHDFSITAALEGGITQLRTGGGHVHTRVERLLAILPAWRNQLSGWNSPESIGTTKPSISYNDDIKAKCYYGSDASKEQVRDSLKKHFPVGTTPRPPEFRIGALATSNILLKDTSLHDRWREAARHLTHVEMEAGGVYFAARQSMNGEIPLLSVRGISDIIGYYRTSEWTQYACETPASFLQAMVRILPVEFFRDPSIGLSIRKIYSGAPLRIRRMINLCTEIISTLVTNTIVVITGRNTKAPSVELIIEAFENSSLPLLNRVVAPNDRIPRDESIALGEFLNAEVDAEARVLCVLGAPGSGKTSVLALLAHNAIEANIPTLAIKADMLPNDTPFEVWGKNSIGLDISALDAIKVVALKSKVLVVVDQLDALASTVDLTSDRLNAVVEFIRQCSKIPRVYIVCSCRTFDYKHDVRFGMLNANTIDLELPSWEEVAIQLHKNGISDASNWPEPFRELLRTPEHLRTYLKRFKDTNNTDVFGSYHLMLDDLWIRADLSTPELDFIYLFTRHLIDNEILWAPHVLFENHIATIRSLESKDILSFVDGAVGFRHQTLLEHAKARVFTKDSTSFSEYVLNRQNAIMVRPTVWAVLRYLRESYPQKYGTELEILINANPRMHLRYLLIEFLGQLPNPTDFETALLAQYFSTDDQLRVLIAIRGNIEWFRAFQANYFPTVMRGPLEHQWPMIGIIVDAWDKMRDACFHLMESNWFSDPDKDPIMWQVACHLEHWDERTVDITCALIRRFWHKNNKWFQVEFIVYAISKDKPQLAPRVFVEAMSQNAKHEKSRQELRHHSPLESTQIWYELPDVAEAAPLEFLRSGWQWLVRVCEEYHPGYQSTVVYHYSGSCYALDENDSRHPEAPVLSAFLLAIDFVSEISPVDFVEITKHSWTSENAVVHRLITRGLIRVTRNMPNIGMEYLSGDRRRFMLGSYDSHEQSDSIELIKSLFQVLDEEQRLRLEQMILEWTKYRDGVELIEDQIVWVREDRLRILSSIPTHLLSPQTLRIVEDARRYPLGMKQEILRAGFVRHIPSITKEEMLASSDESVLNKIKESQEGGPQSRTWVESGNHWEEPGGLYAAGRELAELAKVTPERALHLVESLIDSGHEAATTQTIHNLGETRLGDDEVFALVRRLALKNIKSPELRSKLGYLLYRRSRDNKGLPDDICEIIRKWLTEPWEDSGQIESSSKQQKEKMEVSIESILWPSGARLGLVTTGQSFWPLLAITNGYLMRSPAATGPWQDVLEMFVQYDTSESTWAAYCSELRWIQLDGCDKVRGEVFLSQLLQIIPSLAYRSEFVQLVATLSSLLSESFLQRYFLLLKSSSEFYSRQAYGELITFIALEVKSHTWVMGHLNKAISDNSISEESDDAISVGIAFVAAKLWDNPWTRMRSSQILCRLIPHITDNIGRAVSTVFWAEDDFVADESTESLLQAIADNPVSLSKMDITDMVGHLAMLLPHKRLLVLSVCNAILKSGRQEDYLFQAGPNLVKIAMTLQRFQDTRTQGLTLLEGLLQLGMDDAFRILQDIDIRPSASALREPRTRRRRRPRRP